MVVHSACGHGCTIFEPPGVRRDQRQPYGPVVPGPNDRLRGGRSAGSRQVAFGGDTVTVTHSAAGAHRRKGLSTVAVVAIVLASCSGCLLVGFVGHLAKPSDRAGDAAAVGSAAPATQAVVSPTASTSAAPPEVTATTPPTPRPSTTRRPTSPGQDTDPRYGTCRAVKAHGYGPYYRGIDPEYSWYADADNDGVVCE